MAKIKKSSNEEGNVESVNGESKSPKATKPTKMVKKTFKARASKPPVGEMVVNALKALSNDEGVPLAAIRNYIRLNYNNGKTVGKESQENIKAYIVEEFNGGRIIMTNSDAKQIIFTKRFNMAADAKK